MIKENVSGPNINYINNNNIIIIIDIGGRKHMRWTLYPPLLQLLFQCRNDFYVRFEK
jgi:hypothetical protein